MTAPADAQILRAACCLAGSDGRVDDSELKLLRQIAKRIGVGERSMGLLMQRVHDDHQFRREQLEALWADPEAAMRDLIKVAVADGVLKERERQLLGLIAEKIRLEPARFTKMLQAADKHLAIDPEEETRG